MTRISSKALVCGLVMLSACAPGFGAATTSLSVLGNADLTPLPSPTVRSIQCQPGQYLVGVGPDFSDRMVGVWFQCVGSDVDGHWVADSGGTNFGPGDLKRSVARWHSCPTDYYIVSLAVTTGQYSADYNGFEKPIPAELMADVQPLCWLPRSNAAFYQTPRAYFEQAEDNALRDTGARPPGDPHSCPVGRVAVGILFRVDFGRDKDPESQFLDAALICDRLNLIPINGLNQVTHH